MRAKIILFLISIIALNYSCLSTKVITKKSNGKIIEKYHVLRSKKEVKHGEYYSYFVISKGNVVSTYLKEKGYYKNGKKDSLWVEYYRPTRTVNHRIKSKGKYCNGEKVGIWLTYKREVIEKYDFDKKKRLKPEIIVSLNYPETAKENGIQGSVFVCYKVKSDCSNYDIKILRSLSTECDEEVLRVINRLSELNKKYGVECKEEEVVREFKFRIAG
jgi:TonB family protein